MMSHPIPDAALDADIATLAQKGAGKSYLNKGMVERLLDMKRRVVVMDPLNIWWGLKALADGSAGYAVVVVGGPNADVPLDPKKGTELAAYVAKSDVRMVIDVSDLRAGELVSFSTAFLAELYRLNRDPLWLVLEEADVFCPQNPQGAESFMLHEVDMIARRGRQRGFRLWTICQRPQEINKKALSQTATMVLMRLMSPQDRAAAEKWLLAHGTKEEAAQILTQLPSLAVGEGYVLAPTLGILERAKFPPIRTLDNSATPNAGEKRVGIKALAKVDVGALRVALATVEPEAPAAKAPVGHRATSPAEIKAAEDRGFERGLVEGERRGNIAGQALALTRARNALDALRVDQEAVPVPVSISSPSSEGPKMNKAAPAPAPRPAPEAASGDLTGPQRTVLRSLAWWAAIGKDRPTRNQVAIMCGWSTNSSNIRDRCSELARLGMIDRPEPGRLSLSEAGRAGAPDPGAGGSLHENLRAILTGPQTVVFNALLEAGGRATRDALAEACGWSTNSSNIRDRLSELARLDIIERPAPGVVALQAWVNE